MIPLLIQYKSNVQRDVYACPSHETVHMWPTGFNVPASHDKFKWKIIELHAENDWLEVRRRIQPHTNRIVGKEANDWQKK